MASCAIRFEQKALRASTLPFLRARCQAQMEAGGVVPSTAKAFLATLYNGQVPRGSWQDALDDCRCCCSAVEYVRSCSESLGTVVRYLGKFRMC